MSADLPQNPGSSRTTAGLIVIGDEVLSGRFVDRNTATVIEAMARHGLALREVAIVADDLARIAEVVRAFAARFDLVVTTGGIGPTHDDCTWRAVGAALGQPVVLRPDVLARMEARNGGPLTPEQQRMACLPVGAEVVDDGPSFIAHVGPVWVLPGVPSMVARRIEWLCARHAGPRLWLATVYLSVDEWHVVPQIDAVVAAYPALQIGSYPIFDAPDHRLRLTFAGPDRAEIEGAVERQLAAIGRQHLVRVDWAGPEAGGH